MTTEPGQLFAPHAQLAMQRGIDRLANLVRPTLGPTPRHVAIAANSSSQPPELLDDAGTILRRVVQVPNPYVDMGAMLLRHTLARTAQSAGDGTATTAVLLQGIVRHGLRYLQAGYDAVAMRRGMERGGAAAIAALHAMAQPLDGRAAIGRCASALCSDAPLAQMFGEIFDIVGADGFVQVDHGYTNGLERQYIDGTYWYEGYVSPYFVSDLAKQEARLEDAAVLVSNLRLTSAEQIAPLLDRAVRDGIHSLMLIAQEVSGSALSTLVMNHQAGTLRAVAVKAPLFGEQQIAVLEDLAVQTGGRSIVTEAGASAEKITLDDLGRARVVWATDKAFGLRAGQGDPRALRQRIAEVKARIAHCDDADQRDQLLARLGRLMGGVAVLRVGAATRNEGETRKAQAQRMTLALRHALADGVVPGGGRAYMLCRSAVEQVEASPDERAGLRALVEALSEPLAAIAYNAGYEPTTIVAQVQASQPELGFDAHTGQIINVWDAGILDSAKVAETALQTAISGAITVLTTDVLIHRRNPKAVVEP